MLSLGHEACADRATAPMPHACRKSHGGQLVTTRTCELSDHLIKIFTFPYERRTGGRQGSSVGKEWMQTKVVSRVAVVEMPLACLRKACARIR